jgi:Concanavalin A-like lectin/glucanases superfamily/PASTA domain
MASCDPYFSEVGVLLPLTTTTTDTDIGPNDLSVTANSGVTYQSSIYPSFTNSAAGFDGYSGLNIPLTVGGPCDISSGDFTIEWWMYPTATSGECDILTVSGSEGWTGGWGVDWNASAQELAGEMWGNNPFSGGGVNSVPVDTWTACAIVCISNHLYYYINGVLSGNTAASGRSALTSNTTILLMYNTANAELYCSNFRLTKGVGRYTSNYTPEGPFGTACIAVPDVVGEALATGEATIVADGLAVGTVTSQPSAVPAGDIVSTNPIAGTLVSSGTAVNIVESSGGYATVPNVVGDTLANAQAAIVGAGLQVGGISYVNDPATPYGDVDSQSPAGGSTVATGTFVALVISEPPSGTAIANINTVNDEVVFGAYFGGQLNLVEFTYMPGRTPFEEGATNLILNRYKQEPTDVRQRGIDFTQFVVPGELLQTVTVSGINAQGVPQTQTNPLVTPLVVTDVIIDPVTQLKAGYTVSGGQDGIEYTVQFTTTTSIQTQTLEEIFSINFMIEDMFP